MLRLSVLGRPVLRNVRQRADRRDNRGARAIGERPRVLGRQTLRLDRFVDDEPDDAGLRAQAAGRPVRFMGAFDRDRTAEVYAQIDVLVVPSLWLENSPLVIHEAFMAGVPVVGARIGGITSLIKDVNVEDGGIGLLYDPASAVELRAVLGRLIQNPAHLAALAESVRTAPPVKSIAQDAREWEDTYADVRRRRAAAGPAT